MVRKVKKNYMHSTCNFYAICNITNLKESIVILFFCRSVEVFFKMTGTKNSDFYYLYQDC